MSIAMGCDGNALRRKRPSFCITTNRLYSPSRTAAVVARSCWHRAAGYQIVEYTLQLQRDTTSPLDITKTHGPKDGRRCSFPRPNPGVKPCRWKTLASAFYGLSGWHTMPGPFLENRVEMDRLG